MTHERSPIKPNSLAVLPLFRQTMTIADPQNDSATIEVVAVGSNECKAMDSPLLERGDASYLREVGWQSFSAGSLNIYVRVLV